MEETRDQLVTLVCNYISRGQLELARACLVSLKEHHSDTARLLLEKIADGSAPNQWPSIKSVPTLVQWWGVTSLNELFSEEIADVSIDSLDFGVILEVASASASSFTKSVREDIMACFEGSRGRGVHATDGSLSAESLSALKLLLEEQPTLASTLIRRLLADGHRSELHTPILKFIFERVVEELNTPACKAARVYSLLRLLRLKQEDSAFRVGDLMVTLFQRCPADATDDSRGARGLFMSTDVSDGSNVRQDAMLSRSKVYEALVASGSELLLHSFSKLDDGAFILHAHPPEGPVPQPFAKLRTKLAALGNKSPSSTTSLPGSPSQTPRMLALQSPSTTIDPLFASFSRHTVAAHSQFWRDWLILCRVNKLHCLEYIVERALACAIAGKFNEAAIMTQPTPALKPLVVLLAWDQIRGFDARLKLLHALWDDSSAQAAETIIHNGSLQLAYTVAVSWWCARRSPSDTVSMVLPPHILSRVPPSPLSIPAGVNTGPSLVLPLPDPAIVSSAGAETSETAAKLLHELRHHSLPYVLRDWLRSIPADDILSIAAGRPVPQQDSNALDRRDTDLTLLRAFYALSACAALMNACVDSEPSADQMSSALEVMRKHIMSIEAVDARANVMELVLSMLFLVRSDHQAFRKSAESKDFIVRSGVLKAVLELLAHACNLTMGDAARALTEFIPDTELIERGLKSHSAVTGAVAITGVRTDARSIAFVTVSGNISGEALLIHARSALPSYMVPAEIIVRDSLSAGRDALAQEYASSQSNHVASSPPVARVTLSASRNPSSDHVRELKVRLHSLFDALQDALFRANLVGALLSRPCDSPDTVQNELDLVPSLIASPESLFSMCLRRDMFAEADSVLQRYDLSSELPHLLSLARNVHSLHSMQSHNDSPTNELAHLSLTPLNEFLVVTDLAISCPPQHLSSLLKVASGALAEFSRSMMSSGSSEKLTASVSATLSTFYQRLDILGTSYARAPLYDVLRKCVPYPRDPARLSDFLTSQTAQRTTLQQLYSLSTFAAGQQQRVVQDAIETFSKAGQDGGQSRALVQFLQYMLELSSALGSNRVTEHIAEAPDVLLAELVFEKNQPEAAERVASLMGLDLAAVVLRAALLYPTEYALTDSVLSLVSKQFPLVASLAAAMSRVPLSRYEPMLKYASERTKEHSALQQWVEEEQHLLSMYYDVFKSVPEDSTSEIWSLVAGDHSLADEEQFVQLLVSELTNREDYAAAVALSDRGLAGGASDELLAHLADSLEDKKYSFFHIRRIRDPSRALAASLHHLRYWTAEEGLETLRVVMSHLSDENSDYDEVKMQMQKLKLYGMLQHCAPSKWPTWQDAANACDQDPSAVVLALLDIDAHEAALALVREYDLADLFVEVEERRLLYALLKEDAVDSENAMAALADLQTLGPEAVPVILRVFTQVPSFLTKLTVVDAVLLQMTDQLQPSDFAQLESIRTGLRVLMRLPSVQQDLYKHLSPYPNLIVESLIMNEQVPILSDLFVHLPSLRNDGLVITYAEKALRMPDSRAMSPRGSGQFSIYVLTGDEFRDAQVRAEHHFSQAPFITLAKALLDLCTSALDAGQACLRICDELSRHLSTSNFDQHFVLVTLIRQMIFYAKLRFMSYPEGNSGVALCDSLLSRVDLLQQLVSTGCPATLADLSSTLAARNIRDRLITDDQMSLATEVATKCRIETEPVFAAWGLNLLKLGRYEDAKEKFKFCLTERTDGRKQGVGGFDSASLLNEILDVLESRPPLSSEHLRQLYATLTPGATPLPPASDQEPCWTLHQYLFELYIQPPQKQRTAVKAGRSHLDSVRFLQCVHYIEKYGTPNMLVAFYMRHNSMREAVSHLLKQHVSAQVFVDEIVKPCMRKDNIDALLNVLGHAAIESLEDYLIAACRFLAASNVPHLLYKVQIFMNDWVRAGMTAVQMFLNTIDYDLQLKLLRQAEDHFTKAQQAMQQRRRRSVKPVGQQVNVKDLLQSGATTSAPSTPTKDALSEQEVTKTLATVQRQIEVTQLLQASALKGLIKPTIPAKASLFGSPARQVAITEQLVHLGAYPVVFSIIAEFRLSPLDVYVSASKKLVQRGQVAKVHELLKNIKGTVSDPDWDGIVMEMVKLFVGGEEAKTADKFIERLVTSDARCEAYVLLGNYRKAFTEAAQAHRDTGSVERVKWLKEKSIAANQTVVTTYCDQFLTRIESQPK